jgi:hypothetical protein
MIYPGALRLGQVGLAIEYEIHLLSDWHGSPTQRIELKAPGSLENMLGLAGKFELQRDVFEYYNMPLGLFYQ